MYVCHGHNTSLFAPDHSTPTCSTPNIWTHIPYIRTYPLEITNSQMATEYASHLPEFRCNRLVYRTYPGETSPLLSSLSKVKT